jgi:hypothetical protein
LFLQSDLRCRTLKRKWIGNYYLDKETTMSRLLMLTLAIVTLSTGQVAGQNPYSPHYSASQAAVQNPLSPYNPYHASTQPKSVETLDKEVNTKQGAARIATVQLSIAQARRDVARAAAQKTKASVTRWELEFKRHEKLRKDGVIDAAVLGESEAQLSAARAAHDEAVAKVVVADQEVLLEQVRLEIANAELAEAKARLQPPAVQPPPAPPPTKKADVKELLKAQLKVAQDAHYLSFDWIRRPRMANNTLILEPGQPADAYTWSVRWLHVQYELSPTKVERNAAVADHLQRMTEQKVLFDKYAKKSDSTQFNNARSAANWYVAEAEVWLAKEKMK